MGEGLMAAQLSSLEYVKTYLGDAAGRETEGVGCAMGQVDDPVAMEGTAIIDTHHGGAAIPQIGDLHFGSEGKGAVGSGHRAGAEDLTVGGAVSVETWPIPAGLPIGAVENPGSRLGCRGKAGRRSLLDDPLIGHNIRAGLPDGYLWSGFWGS